MLGDVRQAVNFVEKDRTVTFLLRDLFRERSYDAVMILASRWHPH
jgi:hypothetical protein